MAGGFWAPNGRGDQPGTLDGKTVRCIQLAVKNGEFQTYPAIWPCQDQPLSISVPYCLKPKTETDIWQSPPDPGTALWDKAVPRICVHRFSDNTPGGLSAARRDLQLLKILNPPARSGLQPGAWCAAGR